MPTLCVYLAEWDHLLNKADDEDVESCLKVPGIPPESAIQTSPLENSPILTDVLLWKQATDANCRDLYHTVGMPNSDFI